MAILQSSLNETSIRKTLCSVCPGLSICSTLFTIYTLSSAVSASTPPKPLGLQETRNPSNKATAMHDEQNIYNVAVPNPVTCDSIPHLSAWEQANIIITNAPMIDQ